MKKTRPVLYAAMALLCLGISSEALAQAQRTFVSAATGNDANPCSRSAPCRNFAAAISQTSAGGEVIVLDSGGYGVVTIMSAISIISPAGVYAGVTAFSANAITVTAGATDKIALRGLTLQGLGGSTGVNFGSGKALFIESLLINGFSSSGINVGLSGDGQAFVTDTTVRNGSLNGIVVSTSSGTASATIDNVRLENNGPAASGVGLLASDRSRVIVRGSISTGNDVQFRANSGSGTGSVLDIESCLAVGNGAGTGIHALASAGSATIRVSNSTITNNATGVLQGAGGSVVSRTNNTLEGNTAGTTFPGTYAAK